MIKMMTLTALAATTALSVMVPANAQVTIQTGPPQTQGRNGPMGDKDRDGIPNAVDNRNNNGNNYNNSNRNNNYNRQGNRDQDHDGIPNKYDTDRDGDGTANQADRNPSNPSRR